MAAERKDDAVQRDAAGADNGASWPLYGLFAICALLVAVDPFIHKHGKFELEHMIGFYAVTGFIACIVFGLIAAFVMPALKCPEDYYDE